MADEDFLNDVSNAVDNVENEPDIKQQIIEENTPQTPDNSKEPNVENELTEMFDENDPYKEETKEEPVKKTDDKKKDANENVDEKNKEVKDNQQQQQQKHPSRQERDSRYLDTYLKEDENKNLVDDNGNIIALAGKSRMMFEKTRAEGRAQRKAATDLAISNASLAKQFKDLYTEFSKISEGVKNATDPIQSIVKDTGFSEKEANQAIDFMKQYKADPISAIKNILTSAKLNGIDISKIGANISVDPSLIRSTMEDILKERSSEKTNKENSQEQLRQRAQEEANAFLRKYPEAEQYTQAIVLAKNKFPEMGLDEIWLRIRRELSNKSHQQKQTVTNHYNKPAIKKTEKKVSATPRDYSKMSFDQIAKSITEDNL